MGQPTQRLKPKPTLTQLTTTADGEVMPGPTDTDGVMEDPTDGDTEDTGRERLVRSLQADPTPMPVPRLIPKLTGMAPMVAGGVDGDTDTAPTAGVMDTAATGGGELPKPDVPEPTNDCFQNNSPA